MINSAYIFWVLKIHYGINSNATKDIALYLKIDNGIAHELSITIIDKLFISGKFYTRIINKIK